jgi:hypothetical protein
MGSELLLLSKVNTMAHEQGEQPATPVKKRMAGKGIIFVGVLLVLAFLVGFLPSYAKGKRLENELREARQENRLAELRDLACLVHLQASQKDYGMAAGTSTRLFDRTREVANQAPDSAGRESLEDLLILRDPITAKLATGDPEVLNELQTLVVRTRRATAVSSGARQP